MKKRHRRPGALKVLENAKSRFHGGPAGGPLKKRAGTALAGAAPAQARVHARAKGANGACLQKLTRTPMSKPVELPLTLLAPLTGPKAPEPYEAADIEAPPELLTRATVA